MKKLYLAAEACLLAVTLSACSDAQAKINDSATVLVKIGDTTITKGDLYSYMVMTNGAYEVVYEASRTIGTIEVEVTDDMRESAQSTYDIYVALYGDTFTEYLASAGITEEDYINEYLIPALQAEKLVEKYIEVKWDYLIEEYNPVKCTILSFDDENNAETALEELKEGTKELSEVIEDNSGTTTSNAAVITTESTSIDSMVRAVVFSGSPDDGWTEVPSSDGGTFYVVLIDDNDPNNYKDDTVTALKSITDVGDNAGTYYFIKYGFRIYDITIYNAVAADYPEYLVQDMEADDEAIRVDQTEEENSPDPEATADEATSKPEETPTAESGEDGDNTEDSDEGETEPEETSDTAGE